MKSYNGTVGYSVHTTSHAHLSFFSILMTLELFSYLESYLERSSDMPQLKVEYQRGVRARPVTGGIGPVQAA